MDGSYGLLSSDLWILTVRFMDITKSYYIPSVVFIQGARETSLIDGQWGFPTSRVVISLGLSWLKFKIGEVTFAFH